MELHELQEAMSLVNPNNVMQISKVMYARHNPSEDPEVVAWRKLFAFYNTAYSRIGMGCRGCYGAVHRFVAEYIKKNTVTNA